MRRGCISSQEIQCNGCSHTIPLDERYLVIDEEDGIEVEKKKILRYCLNCCIKKGYAEYREEKGEKILTFFSEKS
ncbi:hypothetical protein ACFLWT_01625 [Chloroflexota bacterium]